MKLWHLQPPIKRAERRSHTAIVFASTGCSLGGRGAGGLNPKLLTKVIRNGCKLFRVARCGCLPAGIFVRLVLAEVVQEVPLFFCFQRLVKGIHYVLLLF